MKVIKSIFYSQLLLNYYLENESVD